jgi:hypothetical protein
VNVNFASQSNNLSALSLANVEALAEENDDDPGYQRKEECTYEEVCHFHEWGNIDLKTVATYHEVSCVGSGSVDCEFLWDVLSYSSDYVACKGSAGHGCR